MSGRADPDMFRREPLDVTDAADVDPGPRLVQSPTTRWIPRGHGLHAP
jgi:hypothetical protein